MLKGNIVPSFFLGNLKYPLVCWLRIVSRPPSDIGRSFQLRFQPHLPPPVTKL